MNVGWLFDGSVFERYAGEMAEAARLVGVQLVDIHRPQPPYHWDDVDSSYRKAFPQGACVVTHADMDLVLRVHTDGKWSPGVFAHVPSLHCSHYYTHLGKYLLGDQYTMLPFGELSRCRKTLFDQYGDEGRIFVRPDSPLKLFSGQLASWQEFDRDLEYLAFYEFPRESLVVVTRPQSIQREWRFVIVDQQVVSGSLYRENGETSLRPCESSEAQCMAAEVAMSFASRDRAWVADICETTSGDFRLLEIGAFSFCDLYACDKVEVLAAVSRAAWDIWSANQG